MRIHLHIGLEGCGADRLQDVLADKRSQLEGKGVLFPRSAGAKNHTRLFMAVTDPENVDPLRFARGFITEDKQTALREQLMEQLERDVARANPDVLILSAAQLASGLIGRGEMETLHEMLTTLSDDIVVTAHVDEPARALARVYAAQVLEGRARGLEMELGLTQAKDWWDGCLTATPQADPARGVFPSVQAPAFWLDYAKLGARWETIFGAGTMRFRSYDPVLWASAEVTQELQVAFDIRDQIGKARVVDPVTEPSARWLARARQMNAMLIRLAEQADSEAIRRIYNQEVRQSAATFDLVERTPEDQKTWLSERSGAFSVLVAELDNLVVGFAALSPYRERAAAERGRGPCPGNPAAFRDCAKDHDAAGDREIQRASDVDLPAAQPDRQGQ